MLGRLMLILVQLVVGWYAVLEIAKVLPPIGSLELFVLALLFAVLVWAIGLLAAAVLKDSAQPGPSALLFAAATAVVFSSLSMFPDAQSAIVSVARPVDIRIYPLVGAVLGYAVQS